VNGDKVPMTPGFGQQPRYIVTIQPVGTIFNPPAAITLPNVDGLPVRAKTEMYSYDHDLSVFVAIGTATVSDDGSVIASDPGVGVLKAGWHCGGDPNASGHVADCPDCTICQGNRCGPDPSKIGAPCDGGTPRQYAWKSADAPVIEKGIDVTIDASCLGTCIGVGCSASSDGFNIPEIADGLDRALEKVFDNLANCIGDDLRTSMQNRLRQRGIVVHCNPKPSSPQACAYATSQGGNFFVVTPSAMQGGCGDLAADLFHEMIHSLGRVPGIPSRNYHNNVSVTNPADCRDVAYGCQESCFPDSTGIFYGNPFACVETPTDLQQHIYGCNPCKTVNGETVCTTAH
jgi:hypothetical protein